MIVKDCEPVMPFRYVSLGPLILAMLSRLVYVQLRKYSMFCDTCNVVVNDYLSE